MFKTLRQLGSILLLSFILINMWMPAYAATNDECVATLKRSTENTKQIEDKTKEKDSCLKESSELQDKHFKKCESSYDSGLMLCDVIYDADTASNCTGNKISPTYVECEFEVNRTKYPACIDKLDSELDSCTNKLISEKSARDQLCNEIFDIFSTTLDNELKEKCGMPTEPQITPTPAPTAATADAKLCGNGERDQGEACDYTVEADKDYCTTTCEKIITKAPSIPDTKTLIKPTGKDVSEVSSYLTSNFLPRIARTVIGVAIASAVFGLILSAITMLLAFGNEEKLGNARKGMYFALVGLVISLLSFAIVQLVFFTGFQIGQVK